MATDNYHTRLLEKDEYKRWDKFVDESATGTIFHKTVWLDNIRKWQNLKFDIAGCFNDKELIGGMAFCWKTKMQLIPIIQLPVKTPYFGVVCSTRKTEHISKQESHIHNITRSVIQFLENKFKHIYAIFPPAFTDVRPFMWNRFQAGIHYTYRLDMNIEMDIRASLYPSLRRQVTKSLLLDFEFHQDNSTEMMKSAWKLEQSSFERQNFRFHYTKSDDFIVFLRNLITENAADIYSIIHQGKTIAANIVIKDNKKKLAYYWLGGVDYEYMETGLYHVLVIKTIEELKSSDIDLFDFGGADTGGIAKNKARYNFPLVPMYSVTKTTGIAKFGFLLKNLFK